MTKEVELVVKEIGGVNYRMKLIPTTAAMKIMMSIGETWPPSPELILEIVSKGAAIGSVNIDSKKFDDHFAGRLQDVYKLAIEILKHNKLVPDDVEEGNVEGSED